MSEINTDIEAVVIQLAEHYEIEFDVYISSETFGRYRSATLCPTNKFEKWKDAEQYGERVIEYFKANNNVFPNLTAKEWR